MMSSSSTVANSRTMPWRWVRRRTGLGWKCTFGLARTFAGDRDHSTIRLPLNRPTAAHHATKRTGLLEGETLQQVVAVLQAPMPEGETLSYVIKVLQCEVPATGSDVSVFIDVIPRLPENPCPLLPNGP